ncbi:MAG: SlyX family protein [Rhodoferax sp.]|nr:SlyX family protein [Rhodoferax sp.]
MTAHLDHEQRLTNLEVKAAFSEDQLDQLDQVIVRQQQQIDALIHQVRALRDRQPEAGQAVMRQPSDDLPPHY